MNIEGHLDVLGLVATVNISWLIGDAVFKYAGPQYVVANKVSIILNGCNSKAT